MRHAFKTGTQRNVDERAPCTHADRAAAPGAAIQQRNDGGGDRPSRPDKVDGPGAERDRDGAARGLSGGADLGRAAASPPPLAKRRTQAR